jgi:hypothetical protein
MYENPEHLRDERVNLSFSKVEKSALKALAALNGCQPSSFMRGLFLRYAAEQGHALDSGDSAQKLRRTY